MVNLSNVVNIEDLRLAAQRRLPRAVFDYIDGGADGEVTMRENCQAFDRVTFRPRCAVATPSCDLKTTVLGTPLALPIMLGPVGSCRLFFPRGEEQASRAAGEAGTVYTLSTLSGCRLEDVRRQRGVRPGISCTSAAAAMSPPGRSNGRGKQVIRRWF